LALAAVTAVVPQVWIGVLALAWVLSGFGMGLSIASTSLAVMTMSTVAEQGRNASSLQVGEALGAGLLVGLAGTIFASLQGSGSPGTAFGGVLATMAAMALVSLVISLRVGRIDNELTQR
jgi:MFS family permease